VLAIVLEALEVFALVFDMLDVALVFEVLDVLAIVVEVLEVDALFFEVLEVLDAAVIALEVVAVVETTASHQSRSVLSGHKSRSVAPDGFTHMS
jgi:hypothetical protein